MYIYKTHISNRSNYGSKRNTKNIKYLVAHYTANDGDTDEGNGNYFAQHIIGASAHLFVDDNSVTQSVPDDYIAWSVGDDRWTNYKSTGGAKYYGICTNANSLSIELCDTVKNGVHDFTAATLNNAAILIRQKMKLYNIDIDHVIRHFDVSGKNCPAPLIDEKKWAAFKRRIMEVDDEVVEKINTKILGENCPIDGIFKDGKNYVGFDAFKKAGLTVTSEGKIPVIDIGTMTVNIDGKDVIVKGFNANGTTLAGIREIAEALGHKVSWKNNKVVIE